MKFNELNVSRSKPARRAGRGISAGRGKTAGRGTKGQRSRTGSGKKPGFEGGQNPLLQKIPKLPGFRSIRPKAENIKTGQLEQFAGKTVDNFVLFDAGLVTSPYSKVKLIKKGALGKKVTVKLQGASEGSIALVQKAGGSFTQIPQVKRQPSEKRSTRS